MAAWHEQVRAGVRDVSGPAAIRHCDVLVIGGGPAGSTAATLLARRGVDVVVMEKERHPRFHIGESLLPCNLSLLRDLGVLDQVAAMGVHKPGAEFVSDTGEGRLTFPFRLAIGAKEDHAYQVRRADFDALLFRNAAAHGAETQEGRRVVDARMADVVDARMSDLTDAQVPGGAGGGMSRGAAVHAASIGGADRASVARSIITARDEDGSLHRYAARFVLDASGRDGVIARRFGKRRSDRNNSTAAVFGHFRNVARREAGLGGYISVHLVEDGWFWMIPLPNDVMSVGFVGNRNAFKNRTGDFADMFWRKVAGSASVAARMAQAEALAPLATTGNYSYRADAAWGPGYYLIGDAYAFLDPVFSSGVLLAMKSAYRGAAVARAWLRDPKAGMRAARRAERRTRREMRRIAWLIYRINTPALRELFLHPRNVFLMRDAIIALLAGDFEAGPRVRVPMALFRAAFRLVQRRRDRASG